jgi:hypothetical protein
MDINGIKSSLQKELEASGIPVSLASAAAQILAEENMKSFKKAKIEGCCNQGQLTSENQAGQSIQRLNQIYEVIA